jgi:hypothetical protein
MAGALPRSAAASPSGVTKLQAERDAAIEELAMIKETAELEQRAQQNLQARLLKSEQALEAAVTERNKDGADFKTAVQELR